MGDIGLKCTACGREFKVSEFIAQEQVSCPGCAAPVPVVRPESNQPRLQLKEEMQPVEPEKARAEPAPKDSRGLAEGEGQRLLEEIHRTPPPSRIPAWLATWVGFLVVGGVLIGLQYLLREGYPQGSYYLQVRNSVGILIYLLTLLAAFNDSSMQGLLCLVVPPYLVYYVLVRTESRLLRGAFVALLLALGTELYFLPRDSLLAQLQKAFNEFVQAAGAEMDRLSAPPAKL